MNMTLDVFFQAHLKQFVEIKNNIANKEYQNPVCKLIMRKINLILSFADNDIGCPKFLCVNILNQNNCYYFKIIVAF